MRLASKTGVITVLLYLSVTPRFATAASHSRFQTWFPRYADELTYIVNHNCSDEYAQWKSPGYIKPIWRHSGRAGPLIDCILRSTPESVKANFNSAAVVLGLMPTLLAVVGPSIQETSILLAYGDHPLLALLICLGSPMVTVDRELRVRSSFRGFKSNALSAKEFGFPRVWWLMGLEYVMALGAVVNLVEVTWELAVKASFTWFKGDAFEIPIWAFIGFVTHLVGMVALVTRTHVIELRSDKASDAAQPSKVGWLRWRCSSLCSFSFAKGGRNQQQGEPKTITQVVVQQPTKMYVLYLMLITFSSLFLIFFGTIVFSSILFIGVHNAVQVWIRVMSSVVVCRVLVLMELAFVRDIVEVHPAVDDGSISHCEAGTQTGAWKGPSQM